MVALGTCKNQLKMKALEWSQHFSHYKSMGDFPDAQGQLTPQSMVTDMVEFRTHPRFYGCPHNLQDNPIKIEGARVVTTL